MRILIVIIIALASLTGNAQEDSSKLTIEFNGIEVKKGNKLFVALYNTENSFLKKLYKGTVVEINNGKAVAEFTDLKSGTYAVSSFYDKNDNGKLDTNFFGIPKEPTAMSNNAKARFGPPKYKDAKFQLTTDKTIIINY